MSQDRLDIIEGRGRYSIGWFNADEGVDGDLRLGEQVDGDDAFSVAHRAASAAVAESADLCDRWLGLGWYTPSAVRKALVVARAAVRAANAERPLEPWEAQALAAGWKPPRGRL